MPRIKNSLTKFLDEKLLTLDQIDDFIDNLEHEVLGYQNREFYLKYKGDIKEFTDKYSNCMNEINYEKELLKALLNYAKERAGSQNGS